MAAAENVVTAGDSLMDAFRRFQILEKIVGTHHDGQEVGCLFNFTIPMLC